MMLNSSGWLAPKVRMCQLSRSKPAGLDNNPCGLPRGAAIAAAHAAAWAAVPGELPLIGIACRRASAARP